MNPVSVPPANRWAVSLDALERTAHVPVEEQVVEVPEAARPATSSAWDEEHRQLRLAGGG